MNIFIIFIKNNNMSLNLIWSLFNLILISYTFYYIKKNNKKDISFNYLYKRVGTQCYKCDADLDEFYDQMDKLVKDKEDFTLCKKCNRDEKLYLLENGKLNFFFYIFKSRFNKLLLSDNFYKRFTLFMTISILLTLIIHFILYFTFNIGFFLWINYSIVTLNFLIILYQNYLRYK
jgi:hypothetical protein